MPKMMHLAVVVLFLTTGVFSAKCTGNDGGVSFANQMANPGVHGPPGQVVSDIVIRTANVDLSKEQCVGKDCWKQHGFGNWAWMIGLWVKDWKPNEFLLSQGDPTDEDMGGINVVLEKQHDSPYPYSPNPVVKPSIVIGMTQGRVGNGGASLCKRCAGTDKDGLDPDTKSGAPLANGAWVHLTFAYEHGFEKMDGDGICHPQGCPTWKLADADSKATFKIFKNGIPLTMAKTSPWAKPEHVGKSTMPFMGPFKTTTKNKPFSLGVGVVGVTTDASGNPLCGDAPDDPPCGAAYASKPFTGSMDEFRYYQGYEVNVDETKPSWRDIEIQNMMTATGNGDKHLVISLAFNTPEDLILGYECQGGVVLDTGVCEAVLGMDNAVMFPYAKTGDRAQEDMEKRRKKRTYISATFSELKDRGKATFKATPGCPKGVSAWDTNVAKGEAQCVWDKTKATPTKGKVCNAKTGDEAGRVDNGNVPAALQCGTCFAPAFGIASTDAPLIFGKSTKLLITPTDGTISCTYTQQMAAKNDPRFYKMYDPPPTTPISIYLPSFGKAGILKTGTSCTSHCNAGFTATSAGGHIVRTCDSGLSNTFSGTDKPVTCTKCEANTYSTGTNPILSVPIKVDELPKASQSACIKCPAGAGSLAGSAKCSALPGYTGDVTADGNGMQIANVTACGVDTYKTALSDGGNCTACPDNTNTNSAEGSVACVAAPGYTGLKGKYTKCSAGTYKTKSATEDCTACPDNTNSAEGSKAAEACVADPGYTGLKGKYTKCSAGTYKTKSAAEDCTACPDNTNSAEGSKAAEACVAAPGYTGLKGKITKCSAGTYKTKSAAEDCTACPDKTNSAEGSKAAEACVAAAGTGSGSDASGSDASGSDASGSGSDAAGGSIIVTVIVIVVVLCLCAAAVVFAVMKSSGSAGASAVSSGVKIMPDPDGL